MPKLTLHNTKGSLAYASIHAVYNCRDERDAKALVWPSDGKFTNPDTFLATSPTPPLLLDTWTASAIIAVYEAINTDNKNKFVRMLKANRVQFMKIADFCIRTIGK